MLEGRGIHVVDSTLFLKPLLADVGAMTRRVPDEGEQSDIAFGHEMAKKIAGLDIGQTVVVAERAVVAVGAMEGTDRTIERAATLSNGKRLVVVKVSKPKQDMRFDVPVILIGAHDELLARARVAPPADLAPGQGAVTFIPPGDVFRAGALLVAGYDATGTLAAAEYLAGRYPNIWAVRGGLSYTEVADRLRRFLTQQDAAPTSLTLDRIVVDYYGAQTPLNQLAQISATEARLLGDTNVFRVAEARDGSLFLEGGLTLSSSGVFL